MRSKPIKVSKGEAKEVFKLTGSWRPLEYIENKFENKGKIVIDHATGLMWQKSGSTKCIPYQQAQEYVKKLNKDQFAGYNDWRLPTIPELISLLERDKQKNDLHINPIFDKKQIWCWSADQRVSSDWSSSGSAWYVRFGIGNVDWDDLDDSDYVRVVRSWQ
jgi:hypothetical protein